MRRVIPFVIPILLAASFAAQADELPRAKPTEVGLSEKMPDEMQSSLKDFVDDGKIAGAVVAVARHGKVAHIGTVGYRDLASKSPMTEDTIFAIASMTKPITCVAAMMLVEEGKLRLDDPVEKFVPAMKGLRVLGDAKEDTDAALATVPARRTMLVRHLFAHTSGLSYGFVMTGSETERRMVRAYSKADLMGSRFKSISELPAELVHPG
jgi:CubicO group peptidase (beta-lactamase class C family)